MFPFHVDVFILFILSKAKKLQEELDARKQEKDVEYRFIAYTGESSPR